MNNIEMYKLPDKELKETLEEILLVKNSIQTRNNKKMIHKYN